MTEPGLDFLKIQNRVHTLHHRVQLSSDNDDEEHYPKLMALTAKSALLLLHALFLLLKANLELSRK